MKPYIEWTKEELVAEKARLEQEFAEVKAKGLNLNIPEENLQQPS